MKIKVRDQYFHYFDLIRNVCYEVNMFYEDMEHIIIIG